MVRLCCAWCAWCAWGSLRSPIALRYTFESLLEPGYSVSTCPSYIPTTCCTLYLPLGQPYAFILGATRGSVRAPSMHLPRYTHTHAHPIITIRPALYTSDTLPVAPSCYINIYRQRLPGGRNLRAARGAARPHRLGAGVTSVCDRVSPACEESPGWYHRTLPYV